jgi:HD superfamily phosphohydrolase
MTFRTQELQFVDTPEFQRLRELKQLGSTYFVFPGGSHNRFEHSLGVAFLAEQMLKSIGEKQPDLELKPREVFLVKVAGLCHDLGHGPFSHVFDNLVIPSIAPELASWSHEKASLMMLDRIIDTQGIEIDSCEHKMIHELIHPSKNLLGSERRFLYDVVSNSRNSVDVDKFDYLARDCHNLGIKGHYDHRRLLHNCRVIDDEICYSSKQVYDVYELFHTRYSLFKQVIRLTSELLD